MMRPILCGMALVLCGAAIGVAQPAPATRPAPAADSDFALTIYSTADPATFDPQTIARDQVANGYLPNDNPTLPGYGVVREIRSIDLNEGENTVKFTDVASGIDPTTVSFKSLTAPDSTSVLEQDYEYDLVSPDKLLQKYLGKTVIINRKETSDEKGGPSRVESLQGTLLSYDANMFVLQTDNKLLPIQMVPRGPAISEIKLFDLQTGLMTKPTLVWKIAAKKAGSHKAQVTYQTDGLTWRADYSVTVNKDDSAADLGAWVTILNASGASYPGAKLKLVAGEVQRLKPPEPSVPQQSLFAGGEQANTGFKEKSFFEYHLYTLGRTTSLPNNATKQIELFPTKTGISVAKIYVYYGMANQYQYTPYNNNLEDRDLGTISNKSVDVYITMNNTEKNGLGIPLPAGRVRLYKRDEADGVSEFIGEDLIQHTPRDEKLMLRVGSAFDIVGERKQTNFDVNRQERWATEEFEIKLRNHKDVPVSVIVKENLFRWATWEIVKCSDKYEKQDSRTIHIPVDVPANGEKTVTYKVKYTW